MFSSFPCPLLLLCFVSSALQSEAATPLLVSVQSVNGTTRGTCPLEEQLAEARERLSAEVRLVLGQLAVGSCNELPFGSPTGYYYISPTGTLPPLKTFCNLTASNPLTSCSELPPGSPGGYYLTLPSSGPPAALRYCNHNISHECGEDGWTRVGFLNMSDPGETCPDGWGLSTSPRRTCGNGYLSSLGCGSMEIVTQVQYTQICGRVVAYHNGSSDGFDLSIVDIEQPYIDGLSLTRGAQGSRQHVWSFITANGESRSGIHKSSLCDCSNGNSWPYADFISYIGDNYFCDTGNHGTSANLSLLNYNDPLWDGEGCGFDSSCCQFNNPPWFHVTLPQPTTDNLEIRNCQANFALYDSLVELIEIYVQ